MTETMEDSFCSGASVFTVVNAIGVPSFYLSPLSHGLKGGCFNKEEVEEQVR